MGSMRRRVRSSKAAPPAELPAFGAGVSRVEVLALGATLLVAAMLRFAFSGRIAIEHFDEGVYASNFFFGPQEGHRYPYRDLYAPPLLPWLIEWLIVFGGPQGLAPFLPALVLGIASVPLAWWACRCWFGPFAGLAAAGLVATSDFHLLYSRTALTDVPVAFFILCAVFLFWEAVRRASLAWSVAAGLATALAWSTKYTGWLPLAIAAAGSTAWLLFDRLFNRLPAENPTGRLWVVVKCFGVMATVAILGWLPVVWGLQRIGGYAAVAENHRGYLQPWQWLHNLWEQAGNLAAQSGILTCVGLAAMAMVLPLRVAWPVPVRVLLALWCAAAVGGAVYEIGPAAPVGILALTALAAELFAPRRLLAADTAVAAQSPRRLAAWLLAAWLLGLTLTTPAYHPYPRLALPWLLAALLACTAWLASSRQPGEPGWSVRRGMLFAIVLLVFPVMILLAPLSPARWETAGTAVPGWEDRTGTRDAANLLAAAIEQDRPPFQPAAVLVYADPALFFHLAATLTARDLVVRPAGSMSILVDPPPGLVTYVATRPISLGEMPPPATDESWRRTHLSRVAEVTVAVSSLVGLDEGRLRPRQVLAEPKRILLLRPLSVTR